MTDYPDVTLLPFRGKSPRIHPSAFIAPGCRIIGDVEIGPDASVWYNCVIRADVNRVVIGARSNIQDGTIIHCDGPDPRKAEGWPTLIGEDVLVGHQCLLHGCTLESRAFVGMGAMLLNGAVVEGDAMLAAGAMLASNKRVPTGQLWAGRPATFMRDLNEAALTEMGAGVTRYVENGRRHAAALGAMLGAAEG